MGKPLVMHYLWWYPHLRKHIIACGKRDVNKELQATVISAAVTCTRCRQTQRFKRLTQLVLP